MKNKRYINFGWREGSERMRKETISKEELKEELLTVKFLLNRYKVLNG